MSILSDESLTAPVNCATFYTLRGHSPLLVTHLGEASQRSADDLRIRCRPHGGQGPHDETAVALGHHARIEDCNDASVIGGTQEAPHWPGLVLWTGCFEGCWLLLVVLCPLARVLVG